jgi:hypothetical protein
MHESGILLDFVEGFNSKVKTQKCLVLNLGSGSYQFVYPNK